MSWIKDWIWPETAARSQSLGDGSFGLIVSTQPPRTRLSRPNSINNENNNEKRRSLSQPTPTDTQDRSIVTYRSKSKPRISNSNSYTRLTTTAVKRPSSYEITSPYKRISSIPGPEDNSMFYNDRKSRDYPNTLIRDQSCQRQNVISMARKHSTDTPLVMSSRTTLTSQPSTMLASSSMTSARIQHSNNQLIKR